MKRSLQVASIPMGVGDSLDGKRGEAAPGKGSPRDGMPARASPGIGALILKRIDERF